MGDQPVPVAVAVGGGLNVAGLVGQYALGGGQGHRVFVDDGVVGAGFAVLGHLEQGIDVVGGPPSCNRRRTRATPANAVSSGRKHTQGAHYGGAKCRTVIRF